MQPYSTDLRVRVLDALDAGMSRREAVHIFQVSLGSIKRWLRLRRTSGDLSPKRPSGRAPSITPNQYAQLPVQLELAPDASRAEHAERWNADHDTSLSAWTIGRTIRRLAWSRKKRL